MARRVLIYRNELLPYSETFILSQANALRRYRPVFAGLRLVMRGLSMSAYNVTTITSSDAWRDKIKYRLFLRTGHDKNFTNSIEDCAPSVVHAHFAVDACAVLPLAQRLGLPLVVTLHGYDVMRSGAELHRWPTGKAFLYRKEALWQYVSSFFCVSESVRQRAIARGFPVSKLRVLPVGIDLSVFCPEDHVMREKTVLFVGRLVEKKGCIYLIRAMRQVQRAMPGVNLVVIGEGPLMVILCKEAASLQNCFFLGRQSHQEVHMWMRRARVLAAPSVQASDGDAEGLPMVLCEAQAAGLPPVTFVTDGVAEALPPVRRAEMPAEKDVDGLADAILHLLRDDAAWDFASFAGRRYMEEQFDLKKQTGFLEDRYDSLRAGCHV